MSSTTVYPNGDGSKGSWAIFGGGTSNIYTVISEGTASPNDSDYIAGPFGAGNYFMLLGDMPGDFGTATAVSFKIRAQYSTSKGDNKSFNCRLYKSDESTVITGTTNTSVSGSFTTYTITPSITGATDKTSWDGARLQVSPQAGSSSGSIFISAVQVEITYTAAASGAACTLVGSIGPGSQIVGGLLVH